MIENPAASAPDRAAAARLAAYSFLILFFELALIRYLPANVRVFSFYINFVLIAAFVGMGAGLLAVRHVERLRWLFLLLTVLVLGLAYWFANVFVRAPVDPDEYLWAIYATTSPTVTQLGILPTVTLLFATCALFFVPLGALVGEEFDRFRPLVAYSLNVGGSLAGILAFALVSFIGTPPWIWFAVGFAVLVLSSIHRPSYAIAVAAVATVAVVGLVVERERENERWSPYYRIDWYEVGEGHSVINVNGSLHLTAVDFSPPSRAANDWVDALWRQYRTPYALVEKMDDVLVLGSGAGNDVSVLLELGAKNIDAVEIDPEIVALGRELNVQQPYADSRVTVHVTDARAYLKQTDRRYDLVVFGTLDSQTLLSGMSSVRLDNYVYTAEGLAAARDVLAPDGALVMLHMSHRPYISAKIHRLLSDAFGDPPHTLHWEGTSLFNYAFIAGNWRCVPEVCDLFREYGAPEEALVPTDNWPYLYLSRPTLPAHYIKALIAALGFAVVLVLAAGGRAMGGGADLQMFLLGLGFLLLETKSVTEMSLLFGSTWQVNLLVFSSILIVILLANGWVLARKDIPLRPILIGLLVSLALGYLVPVGALAGGSIAWEWIVGGALVGLPIFFSALVFARLFKGRAHPVRALGYNVLGAAVGGVLEYSVMLVGVKNLYLLAAIAYALVWVLSEREALRPTPVVYEARA